MKEPFFLRALPYIIGAWWLICVAVIIFTAVSLATLEPENIGSFAGRVVNGFEGAK